MTRERFKQYAWALLYYNLVVIFWGAYVRASFSGDGCGAHWPLCSGEATTIDEKIRKTVEFLHRVTSGLCLIGVILLVIWAFKAFPVGHRVRKAATLSIIFTFSEALLGAALVLFKWVAHNKSMFRAVATSAHLANTFTLLAFLTLTAWCASGGYLPRFRGQGIAAKLLLGALVGVTLLGITGALSALGDMLYPSTSVIAGMKQDFAPTASYLLKLRPLHPAVAVLVSLYVGGIASVVGKSRPGKYVVQFKRYLMWIFTAQLVVGFVNLMIHAPVYMQLIHLVIADALWISLVLLTAAALASEGIEVETDKVQMGLATA